MQIFRIKLIKDYTFVDSQVNNKTALKIYKKIIDGVYRSIIQKLSAKLLSDYNPIITDQEAIFLESSEDPEFLKREQDKINNFLTGNYKQLLNTPEIQRALSNRTLQSIKNLILKNLEGAMNNTVQSFLITFSLKIETSIYEESKQLNT